MKSEKEQWQSAGRKEVLIAEAEYLREAERQQLVEDKRKSETIRAVNAVRYYVA